MIIYCRDQDSKQ